MYAALGPEWARWAALPLLLRPMLAELEDVPLIVLPDHAWVLGPLDGLWGSSKAAATFVERNGTGGGTVPEVIALGADAGPMLDRWAAAGGRLAGRSRSRSVVGAVERAVRRRRCSAPLGSGLGLGPWIGPLHASPGPTPSPTPARVTIDGETVALAHFPGFDPREPWWWPDGEPRRHASQ